MKNKRKITSSSDFTVDLLPSNRRELFFDVLKNHFPKLVAIGLILVAFLIPFFAVSILGDIAGYNLYNNFLNGLITKEEYESAYMISTLVLSLIQCVSLVILSIGVAGVLKVLKRLLFLEPVFFKDDFSLGIKDSWKTLVVSYLIVGLCYAASRAMVFVNANNFIKALPVGVIIVFVLPVFLLINVNTTIYQNSYGKRIRLCTFLYVKTFFITILASLIMVTPLFLLLIPSMLWKYISLLAVVIFLIPIMMLAYFDYSLFIFDKYVNKDFYPEIYRKGLVDKYMKPDGTTRLIDVTKYGVISSDTLLQTKEIQKLIDDVVKEGDILFFPKGTYVMGTIFLKSDMSIELEKGALLLGAESFYDFEPQEEVNYPIYQDQSHTYLKCTMFYGDHLKNFKFYGKGTIDMRSVWDLDNVRDIVHRGPKCITLRECENIELRDLTILNVTDLAVYFVSSENVVCDGLKLKVYIDGISPDNSKHCVIRNCDVESGDDGVVFKSSYNLNRLDYCDDILVDNCNIKSRCNPVKFGTESNGGFKNIKVQNCVFIDSRITGIALESVDGAVVDNISFKNIKMYNIGSPFFVYIGKRMRGPKELTIGSISNVSFEDISVCGPYHVYDCMPWNYVSYVAKDYKQFPGFYSKQVEEPTGTWQITSLISGLEGHLIKNISFKNIYFELDGGVNEYNETVPEEPVDPYPEIYVYGRILPAYAFYFRYVDGIKLENIRTKLLHKDARPKYEFNKSVNIEKDD